jgi:glycosyltransferase involved in cell wall biosynthesis
VKTRTLLIIDRAGHGGAARQLRLLAGGLPPEQFEVRVAALSAGGRAAAPAPAACVPVTVIGRRLRFDPQAAWRLRRHVSSIRPDVVHAWGHAANAYAFAAAGAWRPGRLIMSFGQFEPPRDEIRLAAEMCVLRRVSAVVVNAEASRDALVGCGLATEKIHVIPGAAGPAPADTATRQQLLAELGLPAGSRLVGVVGRLRLRKRVKDAIWAVDLLKVVRQDVHLLIVGDGPHRDRLERFCDQVEIRDKVHFLGQREDAARLVPHLDMLLAAGTENGQSWAILEAMAAGVPVVAADVPAHRELVTDDQTGFLRPVGDRAALARAMTRLLDDPALSRRLGESGRQRARQSFRVETMVDRYAQLYRETRHGD